MLLLKTSCTLKTLLLLLSKLNKESWFELGLFSIEFSAFVVSFSLAFKLTKLSLIKSVSTSEERANFSSSKLSDPRADIFEAIGEISCCFKNGFFTASIFISKSGISCSPLEISVSLLTIISSLPSSKYSCALTDRLLEIVEVWAFIKVNGSFVVIIKSSWSSTLVSKESIVVSFCFEILISWFGIINISSSRILKSSISGPKSSEGLTDLSFLAISLTSKSSSRFSWFFVIVPPVSK